MLVAQHIQRWFSLQAFTPFGFAVAYGGKPSCSAVSPFQKSVTACPSVLLDTKNMVSLVHGAYTFTQQAFLLELPSIVFMVRWSRVDSLASFMCFRHHVINYTMTP